MIVVADTTPLNYLILMDQSDLLPTLYGNIFIPLAVHNELLHPEAPSKVRTWAANPPNWLQFLSPSAASRTVVSGLDAGETEAIALAIELTADWLLIDEIAGRQEAVRRGLKVIGTIGILRNAHELGIVDLKTALMRLQELRFHVSQSILDSLLESIKHT